MRGEKKASNGGGSEMNPIDPNETHMRSPTGARIVYWTTLEQGKIQPTINFYVKKPLNSRTAPVSTVAIRSLKAVYCAPDTEIHFVLVTVDGTEKRVDAGSPEVSRSERAPSTASQS